MVTINSIKKSFRRNFITSYNMIKYMKNKMSYGNRRYKQVKITEEKTNFINNVSLVAIIKNEALYVQEWIEYHKIIGISKFYIYDNESSDNLKEILEPYIKSKVVEYIYFPGDKQQIPAYLNAVERCKTETKWLLTLDLDEYLVLIDEKNIDSFLNEFSEDVAQIEIGWVMFGSSNLIKKSNRLVTETFLNRSKNDIILDSKPIVNPRLVIDMRIPHWYDVAGKTTDENGNRLWGYPWTNEKRPKIVSREHVRVNHYYAKSLEEFENKVKRGYADQSNDIKERSYIDFKKHDINDVYDNGMLKYTDKIKAEIKRVQELNK